MKYKFDIAWRHPHIISCSDEEKKRGYTFSYDGEVKKWLKENTDFPYIVREYVILFNDYDDALKFKLVWEGNL
jgi:hypothetical protein